MAVTLDHNNNNAYYFKSRVQSTHKTIYQYEVNALVNFIGAIQLSHCECPGGGGPLAHCKHVVAMFWGIEQLAREKKIIMASTCTQKLQTFHQPKKEYYGTPRTCVNLNTSQRNSLDYEPLDTTKGLIYTDPRWYKAMVRNTLINFCAQEKSNITLLHSFKPANIPAVLHDHNYVNIDYVHELLRSLYLRDVTPDVIAEVEKITLEQNRSQKWFEIRRHRITASNVNRVCAKIKNDVNKWMLVRNLFNPEPLTGAPLDHGIICESKAIKKFEHEYGVQVMPCGLILDQTYPFIAASPDGLLGNDTVIEVKCPYAKRFEEINAQNISFLREVNGKMALNPTHPYYKQIQVQMWVTNRPYAKLIVYTFKGIQVIDVTKDWDMIREIIKKCKVFWDNYFEPFIVNEYLFKNYLSIFSKEFQNDWVKNSKNLLQLSPKLQSAIRCK